MRPLDSRGGGKIMWFTKVFYQHIMFRHSCGKCHFCNTKRPSDITIADFWGWEKTGSDINQDDKGLNLVLVNTEKGKQIFEAIKHRLDVIEATPESYMQPNLKYPSVIHPKRMQFERDYVKCGFEYVYNHTYHEHPLWRRIGSRIKRTIHKLISK